MTTESPPLLSRRPSALETHPVASFLLLAFAISWSCWLAAFTFVSADTSAVMIPGAFGPALAAAAMVRLRGGSVRAWLVDRLDWRIDPRWYLIALGLPLALGVAFGVAVSVLAGTFDTSKLVEAGLLYPLAVAALALVGGGQEEFGWRGYALPYLQQRWSAVTASVAIGVVWAIWHLPAFAFGVPGYTGSFALYTALLVGLSIVFTWLFNNTSGSVLLAMFLHGGINAASGLGALFGADPSTVGISPYAVLVPLIWAVALVALAKDGHETLSNRSAATGACPTAETRKPEVSA